MMKSKRFMLMFSILILVSLACKAVSGGEPTQPPQTELTPVPTAPLPEEAPTQEVSPAEPLAPETELDEEYRSEEGGYEFLTIPGYTVEEFFGFTSMETPDADPDVGPTILLIGGLNEETKTKEQLFEDFEQDLEEVQISNKREITVEGVTGLAVDVSGTIEEGKEVKGRVVIVAVTPFQTFTMVGSAPPGFWDDEFEVLFEAVLATVTFFEPLVVEEAPEEEPEEEPTEVVEVVGEEIRQWASSATASSEYSSPNWAASQATGEPDTLECGDIETAWASSSQDTVEWLELGYDVPVYPTEVNILQTHSPDQVVMVELIDTDGAYYDIYSAGPEDVEICPYTLSIQVEADYLVTGVRITIDQSVLLDLPWNEIDAVELVGVATGE